MRLALLSITVLLLSSASADAAPPHMPLVLAGIPVLSTLGDLIGGPFGTIGHAVLGAFTWTIGLAGNFILTTIAALVKLLIPQSWVHKGLQIMQWIVAVPEYAGKVTSPGGGHQYGFAGINALRDVFTWLGIAIAPLTLVYATSRAMIGEGDPVGIPVLRMLAVAVAIVSYPYWWSQAAALADQITNAILSVPAVNRGLYKLMDYAVDGVALGGWQLIDLGLMGAIGLELIGLIFLKVVVILLGALLYATGPVMIGLVPTRAGNALARAWASAVVTLLGLGIAWATLFAVGALLIGDAGTAGPLIAGNSAIGSLTGGLLLAVAGLASLWLCIKAAREAAGLLRLQVAGLLALGSGQRAPASTASSVARTQRTTGRSVREYGARLTGAASAAGGELALAGAGGAALARAGRGAGYVGRRGLIGTAAAAAGRAGGGAATPAAAVFARSRAGAVAVRMARAGTASWQASVTSRNGASSQAHGHTAATAVADNTRRNGAQPRSGRGYTSTPPMGAPPAKAAGSHDGSSASSRVSRSRQPSASSGSQGERGNGRARSSATRPGSPASQPRTSAGTWPTESQSRPSSSAPRPAGFEPPRTRSVALRRRLRSRKSQKGDER